VIDANVSGDDPATVARAGRVLDERTADADDVVLDRNPVLRAMGEIAAAFGVSVTLTVYPVSEDDGRDDSDDSDEDDRDDAADRERER
jgi:hypothetical protein